MLTFTSIDSDACPADCVTEVFTPEEFKTYCEVRPTSLALRPDAHACALALSVQLIYHATAILSGYARSIAACESPSLQAAGSALVVVDFFKTSCGSCKYILPGFIKLCKSTQDQAPEVVFLKHNVFDDYEEEKTDLARRLRIVVCAPAAVLLRRAFARTDAPLCYKRCCRRASSRPCAVSGRGSERVLSIT